MKSAEIREQFENRAGTQLLSYEEAVRFFMDEVGLERSAAEAEVNRFTTWPTQAPSYIIGWLELERLKAELQQALGEALAAALKDGHLGGAGPDGAERRRPAHDLLPRNARMGSQPAPATL